MLKTDRVLRQWSRLALCVGGSLLAAACSEEETPEPVIRPVRYTQVYASGDGRVRVFSGQARAAVESRLFRHFGQDSPLTRLPACTGFSTAPVITS